MTYKEKIKNIMNGISSAPMAESMGVSPRWENKDMLLKAVMEKLNITEEDMDKRGFIKEKLREINLDILLS